MMINRRSLLTTALTLGAVKAFPGLSYAQVRPLVFATFTGSWEEAHKAVLVGQCVAMGRGLLSRKLRRRAEGWFGMDY
jgi:hypothetical protein